MLRTPTMLIAVLAVSVLNLNAADYRDTSASDLKSPVYTHPGAVVVVEAESLLGSDYGTEWRVSTDPRYSREIAA